MALPAPNASFTPAADNPPKYRITYGHTEFAGSFTCNNIDNIEIIAANLLPAEARPHDRTKALLARVTSQSSANASDTTIIGQVAGNGRLTIYPHPENVGKIICLDTMVWNRN